MRHAAVNFLRITDVSSVIRRKLQHKALVAVCLSRSSAHQLRKVLRWGRSRSFKVTKIDTSRKPICDFVLVFHCNNVYLLPLSRFCWSKNFPSLPFCPFLLVCSPRKGVPLGPMQEMKVGNNKLGSLATRRRKPHHPTVISFDALPAYDRQTDGHAACTYVALQYN